MKGVSSDEPPCAPNSATLLSNDQFFDEEKYYASKAINII